ncbi:unnamed protein product [Onchocerca flexuosa]|uniref:Ovule protein n=1 Tax=Onchocerca flexuosa TaxID=387005 RepID=A0A183H018_9BILA|nr:unnamed protein product [Onchocerca flexuosa]
MWMFNVIQSLTQQKPILSSKTRKAISGLPAPRRHQPVPFEFSKYVAISKILLYKIKFGPNLPKSPDFW